MLNTDRYAAAVLLCLLALSACSERVADPNDPDLLLINGNIITMDDDESIVEAVSIRGNKIVAIGTTSKVKGFAGPDTQIIDLDGLTVTPGLIDVHNHFAWGAFDQYFSLNLSYPGVTSINDVLAKVKEAVEARNSGEWIIGAEWDAGKLSERRDISAADLDAVSPDNPVWLLHTSAHYGVANSNALALADITSETPDPDGGVIVRYEAGKPTGILMDQAMSLIGEVTPTVSADHFDEATTHLVGQLNAEGITTIKDPEIDERHWEAYKRIQSRGELSVRVFVLWRAPDKIDDAEERRIDATLGEGLKLELDHAEELRASKMFLEALAAEAGTEAFFTEGRSPALLAAASLVGEQIVGAS